MKKLVLSAIAAVLTVLGLSSVATMSPAYAAKIPCPNGTFEDDYSKCSTYNGQNDGVFSNSDLMGTLTIVINVVVGVIGFVAVVMIVMGGIGFATSQGDAAKVTKARNTILYGVVGLVVALLAFAVVNFVLNSIF